MTAQQDAAKYFQQAVGGPLNAEMSAAIQSWLVHESGTRIIGNNPWNLHVGPACPINATGSVLGINPSQVLSGVGGLLGNRYAGSGDRNVAIYDTLQHGVQACVANLISHGSDYAHYDKVLAAARAGDGLAFLNALAASSWSAGRYGTINGGPNNLLPYYYKLLGDTEVIDPNLYVPVGVCDVAAGGTLYSDPDRKQVLVATWQGAKNVGIFGIPLTPTSTTLVPIRIQMRAGGPVSIAWVGWNLVTLHPSDTITARQEGWVEGRKAVLDAAALAPALPPTT